MPSVGPLPSVSKMIEPQLQAKIDDLAVLVCSSRYFAAFTGAGISTESGIPDFRGPQGVWTKMQPIELSEFLADAQARREYWRRKIESFPQMRDARPNAGHLALARLFKAGLLKTLITQNIDGLHQKAGGPIDRVIEIHGSNAYIACLQCHRRLAWEDMLPFLQKNLPQRPWAMPATPMRGLELWKPLIAAINGLALGGGLEIALACDIRIASEKARLGVPEVTLGLIPGWGGTQRLPRMVPRCKAAEMLLTGKAIDAQEAYRIGLVNTVVPSEAVMPTAREWAETICQAGPLAVRAAKEAIIRGSSLTLEEGLRLESDLEAYLMSTEDFAEGTQAYVEKRKPDFKAR